MQIRKVRKVNRKRCIVCALCLQGSCCVERQYDLVQEKLLCTEAKKLTFVMCQLCEKCKHIYIYESLMDLGLFDNSLHFIITVCGIQKQENKTCHICHLHHFCTFVKYGLTVFCSQDWFVSLKREIHGMSLVDQNIVFVFHKLPSCISCTASIYFLNVRFGPLV